jgi:uncharacterized protein (TIGR00645 family)
LSLALVALVIKFFGELLHVLPGVLYLAKTDPVHTGLALVDLALVGSLIVMVMLSGYEHFVSKMDVEGVH